ncbi:MAG: rod shape-determining protein MreD [Candidatus Omnitrophica bacterium]|nr:rod shape-determining protein MreD [Candidatus Omnitrophota bacterium]
MKKYFYFLLIIFLCGVIQVSLLDAFRVIGIKPDLCLIMTLIAAFNFRPKWAFGFGVFAGLMKDIFSSGGFGMNVAVFSLLVFLVVELNRRLPLDYGLIQLAVAFIVSILSNILSATAAAASGKTVSAGISAGMILLASVYTALIFLPVSRILKPVVSLS